MPSTRDFARAQAFRRRRLVDALVTGAVRGDGPRRGGLLVGGVLLAALLLGGGAVTGRVLGRPPADWLAAGSLVVSAETGQAYVVPHDDRVLHRVPDAVSARLALGEAAPSPHVVGDDHIADAELGEDLGIPGAPAGLPAPDALAGTGWTACTAEGAGVRLAVLPSPDVSKASDGAALVSSHGRLWLVADAGEGTARRHEIVADPTRAATLAGRLGFGGRTAALEVDPDWLALLPRGPALSVAGFGVRRLGEPAAYAGAGSDLSSFRVGDLLRTPAGSFYLLGDAGPERLLSPFAVAVWSALHAEPLPVDSEVVFDYAEPGHPAAWPDAVPTPLATAEPCLVLDAAAGRRPAVELAADPGRRASAAEVAAGGASVEVDASAGALVRPAGGGTVELVASAGTRHRLVGDEVAALLGLGDVDPTVVPGSWLGLVEEGVALSSEAARD